MLRIDPTTPDTATTNAPAKDKGDTKASVHCREIRDEDIGAVAGLLARGFCARPIEYWLRGLKREQVRAVPEGYPRYGCMMESDGHAVGVLLAFFSNTKIDGRDVVTCNVGAWYVDPPFRGHAPRLIWTALKRKEVLYTDVTPSVPTYAIVEKIGFRPYCEGLFFSLPLFSLAPKNTRIEIVTPKTGVVPGVSQFESDLLVQHASYGCVSMVCRTQGREPEPFIFLPFRMRQGKVPLPAAQVVYCRGMESYKCYAGAISRRLLRRGRPIVIMDANAAIDGLFGIYTKKRGRKYFRGSPVPRLADLTNTELVLFGL